MKRPKETLCNSTDVRNPFLGFYFNRGNGLRRKLEHRCFLTFKQVGQQHDLALRKFQRIVMCSRVVLVDLPKDRGGVIEGTRFPTEQAVRPTTYGFGKRKLCSRKNANRCIAIFRRSKPNCASIAVSRQLWPDVTVRSASYSRTCSRTSSVSRAPPIKARIA
jgi:hypothetical protein